MTPPFEHNRLQDHSQHNSLRLRGRQQFFLLQGGPYASAFKKDGGLAINALIDTSFPQSISFLSVVVPVYNEADNVLPLVTEIHGALEKAGCNFEVVYVDDGSGDATWENITSAKNTYPRLRGIKLAQNCGQSTALYVGVRQAQGPFIVTLDGDGQNDPADIPLLMKAAFEEHREMPPLVTGVRINRRDTWFRRLSSRIANRIRRALLNDGTPDTGCSLKLFTRESFLALPFFDHMHRFIPALYSRAGCSIVLVDVNHRPRKRGTSKYGLSNRLWVGISDLAGVMWLNRRNKSPLIHTRD